MVSGPSFCVLIESPPPIGGVFPSLLVSLAALWTGNSMKRRFLPHLDVPLFIQKVHRAKGIFLAQMVDKMLDHL